MAMDSGPNRLKLEQCLALTTQLHTMFKTSATTYRWGKGCRDRKRDEQY